jgi:hypothetical protein
MIGIVVMIKENATQVIVTFEMTSSLVKKHLLCYELMIVHYNGWYMVLDPNAKKNGKQWNEIASRLLSSLDIQVYGDVLVTSIFNNFKNINL